ncbi:hypothetical protein SAMN06265173_1221 [Thalassovita litoralis]|jgi:Flp pilus assembly pilin Flp|uniref:Flp pilus assembly protein, pilin Flp n=1 Tax=Thalassovita litoralis TaxID=1010611 RepID=A0A521EZY4_9RHOB|nr:hypothetical protein [Thalassovita litoralis]SMO89356.1 hypothetical protein SAMN06265173_1221 [Thalassovita litoralis]
MFNFIRRFHRDESGAVTVDWVVLTAAVVGLAVAAFASVETSIADLVADIVAALTAADATTTIGS